MQWRNLNLNIETEKSEQTLFAQISLSQYKYLLTVCAVKRFYDCNTKLAHAELLSLDIHVYSSCSNQAVLLARIRKYRLR